MELFKIGLEKNPQSEIDKSNSKKRIGGISRILGALIMVAVPGILSSTDKVNGHDKHATSSDKRIEGNLALMPLDEDIQNQREDDSNGNVHLLRFERRLSELKISPKFEQLIPIGNRDGLESRLRLGIGNEKFSLEVGLGKLGDVSEEFIAGGISLGLERRMSFSGFMGNKSHDSKFDLPDPISTTTKSVRAEYQIGEKVWEQIYLGAIGIQGVMRERSGINFTKPNGVTGTVEDREQKEIMTDVRLVRGNFGAEIGVGAQSVNNQTGPVGSLKLSRYHETQYGGTTSAFVKKSEHEQIFGFETDNTFKISNRFCATFGLSVENGKSSGTTLLASISADIFGESRCNDEKQPRNGKRNIGDIVKGQVNELVRPIDEEILPKETIRPINEKILPKETIIPILPEETEGLSSSITIGRRLSAYNSATPKK